jgi:hypothetical protein
MFNNKKFKKAIILTMAFFISTYSYSQSKNLGSWNVANVEVGISNKWSLWAEGQLRSQKMYKEFFYHELKGGVIYKPSKNLAVLVGTGQYVTYSNGGDFKSPVLSHEHRVWEQLTLTNNISRVKLEHRYRIEQRFFSSGYRNRFRYRLNAIVPINSATVKKGTVYGSAYNEVFLTNKKPYFERNRLSAGAGYVFSDLFSLQLAWVQQFDYRLDQTSSNKNFLQATLFFRFNSKGTQEERHPSSID